LPKAPFFLLPSQNFFFSHSIQKVFFSGWEKSLIKAGASPEFIKEQKEYKKGALPTEER
jgi:hypothetical protein